jgi:CDP-glycerol glycerophosphotransferase (TagB/SpsB family)
MGRIKKIFEKLLINPFCFLIYFLIYLFPRDNKKWVFGSGVGMNFSDNAKYLFLYCSQQTEIKSYWITSNKELVLSLKEQGLKSYHKYSIKGIWLSITSKLYIYDSRTSSINHWTSAGALKVNLWHGSPLKTIDRDITVKHNAFYIGNHTWGPKRYLVRMMMPEWFVVADMMIATSKKVKQYFKSAFGSPNIEITGYPRNDIIISPNLYAKYLGFEQEIIASITTKKTILYAPTFRDTNRFNRETPIDWERLNDLLKENNTTFLIKLHRHDFSMVMNQEYSNIRVLDNESDMYPLFAKVDLLVTDYSSIFFDFLLTNKPVLFFPYDKVTYLTKDRSMYDDYDLVTPGYKAYNFEELYTKLELFFRNASLLKRSDVDYDLIKVMYNKYSDSKGAERTYQFIKSNL